MDSFGRIELLGIMAANAGAPQIKDHHHLAGLSDDFENIDEITESLTTQGEEI